MNRSQRARTDSNPASNELLDVRQAADYLNVGVRFVRRLIHEKRVAYVKLGRHVRLCRRDLDALVARGREPARPESPRGKQRP